MKLRKNAGSKKREKSFEISRFFSAVWLAKRLFSLCGSILTTQHRASLQNRCTPHFFQNRAGLFCFWIDLSLGETETCKWPRSSGGIPYLQTNLYRFSINNFIEQNKNFINKFVLLLCVSKFFKQINNSYITKKERVCCNLIANML